jgi:hypothetical protein
VAVGRPDQSRSLTPRQRPFRAKRASVAGRRPSLLVVPRGDRRGAVPFGRSIRRRRRARKGAGEHGACFHTPSRSAKDAIGEVRYESGAARLAEQFELNVGRAFQQPLAGAEQDGDDVQPQLVDQAGGKVLVDGRGAAGDCDIAVAGRLARPFERRLGAVGDEVDVVPPSICRDARSWWERTNTGA